MEYNRKYHNCLRLQITDDCRADERISDMVKHCVKYGFDNVMLMFNAEDFNRGHITCEAASPWLEVLRRAANALKAAGISVSLNNWLELGHADRGMQPYVGQNFNYLVDMNGRSAEFCTCPLDKNWLQYYKNYVTFLVKELKPDTFWIEDDFRLHNHAPLYGVGCFCPLHMAEYNRRLGTNYTREQFVERVFAAGEPTKERAVFLNVSRDCILSLAAEITAAVKAGNPATEVGLMSSAYDSHLAEARDWGALFETLSCKGNKISRIHMCYGEPSGKDNLWYLNSVSMPVRAASPKNVVVLPEVEHGPSSQFARSPRYLRFALEAALPLVLSGMTYSIYDFIGNGVRESSGYGQVVKEVLPLQQAVLDLHLQFDSLVGVLVPIDCRAAYCLPISKNGEFSDLKANESKLAAYISALGVSYAYTKQKNLSGACVLLCKDNSHYFTDDELRDLFKNNYVILDGGAVLELQARGLLSLIGAHSANTVLPGTGFHAYEECSDQNLIIEGVRGLRASCRASAGDFINVVYDSPVTVRTEVKNHLCARVANGFVEGSVVDSGVDSGSDNNSGAENNSGAAKSKGFAVVPYPLQELNYSQFCDLRRHFITQFIAEHAPHFAIAEKEGVSPYLFKTETSHVLMLVNGNCESYSSIALRLGGVEFSRVSRLTRAGKRVAVRFLRNDSVVTIKTEIEYYATTVLVLE